MDRPLQFGDYEGDGDLDGLGVLNGRPVMLRNDGAGPLIATGPGVFQTIGEGRYTFADVRPGNGIELIGSTADHLYITQKVSPADWGAWVQTAHPGMYEAVAVDFEGDGDLDLVGVGVVPGQNTLVFLENDGAGAFRQQQITTAFGGTARGRVWPADLNRDGYEDFVVAHDDNDLHFYATGVGVLGATFEPRFSQTSVRGRSRQSSGTVSVQALVPLPEPVAITELTMLVDGAPGDQVLHTIEVVSASAGRPTVGRLEGAALQGELRVPLAGDGLLVDDVAGVQLTVYLDVRAEAHQAAPAVHFAWESVAATFTDGEPAPVVSQIQVAQTWFLPNDAPTARADAFDVPEGAATLLDVTANDSDPEGDPLAVEIIEAPAFGLAEAVDGQVRYTHDGREAPRADRFSYRALDPRGEATAVVEVALTITSVNDPPQTSDDAYVAVEDVPLVIEADIGLLLNDTDADSALLSAVLVDAPASGDLELAPDGGFIYVPARDFEGEVTFAYQADDGEDLSAPATVTIIVTPENDPPQRAEGAHETPRDTATVLQLAGPDPEGDAVVLLIESFPDHGHLVALRREAGQVTYVPPPGFVGEARFTYRLTDRAAVSPTLEAVVTVRAP